MIINMPQFTAESSLGRRVRLLVRPDSVTSREEPGVLNCLTVNLILDNDYPTHLQTVIGVDNTCPVDVSAPIYWTLTSTLSCGDQTIPGPFASGTFGQRLVKSYPYTIANPGFDIECIIDNLPGYWTIAARAVVGGGIDYRDFEVAKGAVDREAGGV